MTPGFRAMTSRQVIHWWERRRIVLNLILLPIAVATWFGVRGVIGTIFPLRRDLVEPALLAGALAYLVVVNLVYTFGWMVELKERQRHPLRARQHAVRLFKEGLLLGVIATTLPLWIACAIRLAVHLHR